MKIIVIGDIHGRSIWKEIVKKYKDEDCMFIFIGDYFDSFDISGEEQLRNFKEICEFKEKNMDKVILLIGNHDTSYIIGDRCSGYQEGNEHNIKHLLSTYYDLLQMSYSYENVLFSHAGVCESWINNIIKGLEKSAKIEAPEYTAEAISNFVNDMWKFKRLTFVFTGRDGYGDDAGQTPVWIRPRSLMKDTPDMKKAGIVQVVGHTGQSQIDIEGKSTGKKFFFIDTLGTNQEYLIIKNKAFQSDKIYNYEK